MATWFDKLFDEYHGRKQALFAFSRGQVEEEGVTWEEFQRDWASLEAGLHVRKDVVEEFVERAERDREAVRNQLPTLHLEYIGERGLDHHTFRETTTGVYYCDTSYTDLDKIQGEQPDLAVVSPPDWEPSYHVANRYVIEKW